MGRTGTYSRETKETSISVTWNLDGTGKADVSTGIGMLDHLVSQIARHGIFDITCHAKGDLNEAIASHIGALQQVGRAVPAMFHVPASLFPREVVQGG